jgi:hypothetical protein
MHGRADHHLAGFQIRMPRLALAPEQDVQPLAYLAGDLFKDRSSRFFSSGVHESLPGSSGRWMQILSLIAINSALSFWKRWYSSISDCAFRQAEGEENDSAHVFPSTLRVRRTWGSCPGSFGLAQWQVGFPQRRAMAQIEPVRRSPRVVS